MIWITTFLFFFINIPVVWIGFSIYARTLKAVGAANSIIKYPSSILIYLLFSVFIISPILIGLSYFPDWNIAFNENIGYMIFFLACYVISVLPGFLHFKKTYLESLQQLGYFKENR